MDEEQENSSKLDRREFVKIACATTTAALFTGCNVLDIESILQQHFLELDDVELDAVLKRLEKKYSKKYNKKISVEATSPIKDVLFGYGLDLSRCIGCRKCVYACVDENNQSRTPEIQWIKVLQMDKNHGVDLHHADAYYNPKEVPEEGHFYMPVQCQQCKNPPCTKVCPVKATWTDKDGIVVIDYNWCIGCRNCMAACPYGARKFNWATPKISSNEVNPNTHYLGNIPRNKGVVEKCTFCIHKSRKGKYTSCVEACPVGARKFGNLLDPTSEIREILKTKRVFIFKQELNTHPKFFYFYG